MSAAARASFAQFFEDGYTIKDVRNNITWLRCTVGQTWDYDTKTCVGKIVKLNHDEIEIARTQAAEASLQQQISSILSDADPSLIDSLSELLSHVNAQDQNLINTIATLQSEFDDLKARFDQLTSE